MLYKIGHGFLVSLTKLNIITIFLISALSLHSHDSPLNFWCPSMPKVTFKSHKRLKVKVIQLTLLSKKIKRRKCKHLR